MSRRRPGSQLDLEFANRDLIRMGRAAALLHVTHDLLRRHARMVTVDWRGHKFSGIPADQMCALHDQMWRNGCPWAAKGECELAGG